MNSPKIMLNKVIVICGHPTWKGFIVIKIGVVSIISDVDMFGLILVQVWDTDEKAK